MLRLVRLAPAFGWSRGRVGVHFFFEDKKKSSLSRAFFSEKDETFSRVKCSRINKIINKKFLIINVRCCLRS
jgi:hypothetical protein